MKEVNKIIKMFHKYDPIDLEELLEMGVGIKGTERTKKGTIFTHYLGEGSFRKVYRINNLPLVVKFPTGEDGDSWEENLEHAQNEIDALNWVKSNKKFKEIRQYLPNLHYSNEDTGVMLLDEYVHVNCPGSLAKCRRASEHIAKVMKVEKLDFYKNFVTDKGGNVTLLDWGILGRLSNWREF